MALIWYPTLADKATALGFVVIQGHPFVDGNERVGYAAVEPFLVLNGSGIGASVDRNVSSWISLRAAWDAAN